MKRLIEQSACVHGYFGDCTFTVSQKQHQTCGDSCPLCAQCPGGTSREVEVDYEAGAVEWIRVYETWPNEPLPLETAQQIARGMKQGTVAEGWNDDQFWREHLACVTAALDAALGGGR